MEAAVALVSFIVISYQDNKMGHPILRGIINGNKNFINLVCDWDGEVDHVILEEVRAAISYKSHFEEEKT